MSYSIPQRTQFIFGSQHNYVIEKQDKRQVKNYRPIPTSKCRCEIRTQNAAVYQKDNTPDSKGVHSRNSRMAQQEEPLEINVIHHINKTKVAPYISRC